MRPAALLVVLFAPFVASAQTPPAAADSVLRYEGKPLAVAYRCTNDDIHWAGLSCSEDEPCDLYLELSAVEAVGNRLVVIGNIHSDTVTLYSVVLASDDTGKTWREVHPRIRGAGLEHIQFIDFETGWIGGQSLSPLPQDSFLLVTGDGGKTWRQQNLFGEPRIGSIAQLWFAAKTSGSLIIDRGQGAEGNRYELYESPNAGATWMIRETSDRPIKLKRGPADIAAWRLRTDAPSHSFRIEHQIQPERWNAVAAFLVPIGKCIPPAPREAPEPAVEPATPPVPPVSPSLKKKLR